MKQKISDCLDGSTLTVSSDTEDLGARETHVVRATAGRRVVEFSASRRDEFGSVAEAMALTLGTGPYANEHSYGGARVRFARARTVDAVSQAVDELLLSAWEGRDHVVVLPTYHTSPEEAIALLNHFDLAEREHGVACVPRRGATMEAPNVVLEIPPIGLLEITYLSEEVRRTLPPWEGTRLSSGELFKDALGNGESYYVLVSETARAVVMPSKEATESELVSRLDGVHLDWAIGP